MNCKNELPTNDKMIQTQRINTYYNHDDGKAGVCTDSFDKHIQIKLLRAMFAKNILNKQTYDKVRQIITREEVARWTQQ